MYYTIHTYTIVCMCIRSRDGYYILYAYHEIHTYYLLCYTSLSLDVIDAIVSRWEATYIYEAYQI